MACRTLNTLLILQIGVWNVVFPEIVLPDLGTLSDKEMDQLVYSLLDAGSQQPGDIDTRAWTFNGINRRSPMQLDHSNPTTRLFTYNPYGKRSGSLFSGMRNQLARNRFMGDLYKRASGGILDKYQFLNNIMKREAEEEMEEAEKRSGSLFSGMRNQLARNRFMGDLYKRNEDIDKRSASLFSGMRSQLGRNKFMSDLYKRSTEEPEKRSGSLFSGMRNQLARNQFMGDLYKRESDNYNVYNPNAMNAADYWNKLSKMYRAYNLMKNYRNYNKRAPVESAESIKPSASNDKLKSTSSLDESTKKAKKTIDDASPASL